MNYILDTHTLLWIIDDDPQLSRRAKQIYFNVDNKIFVSLASIWEIIIKASLGKLLLDETISEFVNKHIKSNDIHILNINLNHIIPLENLTYHHKDPFDRFIIAQSMVEETPVLSSDEIFDKYPIKRIW